MKEESLKQLRQIDLSNQSFSDPLEIEDAAEELVQKLQEKLKSIGVDFDFCQLTPIIQAHFENRLEMETVGPYAMDHDIVHGTIQDLTTEEKIGLSIAAALKRIFRKATIVSLCDNFHTGMTDSSDIFGKPQNEAPQIKMSSEAQSHFLAEVERIFRERGIIQANDVAGKSYILLSESDRQQDAENMVEALKNEGMYCQIQEGNNGTFLIIQNPESADCQEIKLKNKQGKWTCEALDAAGFIQNPENRKKCHLIVLPENMKAQQNRVWHILRALGYTPDNYHNIFYNENICSNESVVANAILEAFEEAIHALNSKGETVLSIADLWRKMHRTAQFDFKKVA